MNTKIIYVLVSNDSDIYYEQTLLSAFTLKHYNSDAKAYLVVDTETAHTLVGSRYEIHQYIDDIIITDVPLELNPMQRSRHIKTSLRSIIDGDFFYVDSDTIICGSLDKLDNINDDIAAVPDAHGTASQSPWYMSQNKLVNKLFGTQILPNSFYFNSGGVFVKNTKKAQLFFKRWHENWQKAKENGCDFDQPAFYYTNQQMDECIAKLNDIYDCQLSVSFTYFSSALVLHYWGSFVSEENSPIWARKSFYQEIKNMGYLTEETKRTALNCKTSILTPSILLQKRSYYDFFNSEFGLRVIKEFERRSFFLKIMQVSLRIYQKAITLCSSGKKQYQQVNK